MKVYRFGSCIDVNQFTIASELFPSHLRSQGSSIAISALFLVDTLWLDLASTAMATIGWKYYLVFVFLGIVHGVFFYFFLPETSGLALEEIDALFGKEAVGHVDDTNLEKMELVEDEQVAHKSVNVAEDEVGRKSL